MSRNFHESFAAGEVPMPSERSTGLVFAAVALIIAVLWRKSAMVLAPALAISGVLAAVSLAAPTLLRPLNIVWFRFGLLLHKIMSPVVMFLMFAVAIVPFGLLMQLRRDPLRRKRQPDGTSYWIDAEVGESQAKPSMKNQF